MGSRPFGSGNFGEFIIFAQELLKAPGRMGTFCPSGAELGAKMADKAAKGGTGLVLELGAGTGRVTHHLISSGISHSRLVVVEYAQAFVDLLHFKYPGLKIIKADAAKLSSYLDESLPVECIVSSLPFASFNKKTQERIIREIKKVMPKGRLIQYTYLLLGRHVLQEYGFSIVSESLAWRNLPPARIIEFEI